MADSGIKIRVEGEIAYIALDRPEKRNAINQAMRRADFGRRSASARVARAHLQAM